jgi:hypothetical protein
LDAENAVKACNIGQDESTSGGSPQHVCGEGKFCSDGTFADPRNNKKMIGMGWEVKTKEEEIQTEKKFSGEKSRCQRRRMPLVVVSRHLVWWRPSCHAVSLIFSDVTKSKVLLSFLSFDYK